jgi:hypothetical protein
MSILNASVLVDGTVATTGGTATSMIMMGDGENVILDEGLEFNAQTKIAFHSKDPKVSSTAPNGYTQHRTTIKILKPLLLDNGNYTMNSVTITFGVDHETTDAEITSLRVLAAQLLHDSDFDDFWNVGSRA